MEDLIITQNIKLYEWKVSTEFPELAKRINFTPDDIIKIFYHSRILLEPIRLYAKVLNSKSYIKILSGKRTKELNIAIKGKENSEHLFNTLSCACDFTCHGVEMLKIFNWICENLKWSIGQIIYYPNKNFIHISLPTKNHYKEAYICNTSGIYVPKML